MFRKLIQLFRKSPAKQTKCYERPEHAYRVWDSGDAVHCVFEDSNERIARWETLKGIIITTTDEGPWCPDVFWHFIDVGGEVVFPDGALGWQPIVDRVTKLKGFDFEEFTAAIRSTDNATFIVWKKSS